MLSLKKGSYENSDTYKKFFLLASYVFMRAKGCLGETVEDEWCFAGGIWLGRWVPEARPAAYS